MDLFADSSDDEAPAGAGGGPAAAAATSSSASAAAAAAAAASSARKRPHGGAGPETAKRARREAHDARLAAAARAVLVRCRIFATQTVPATAKDLREAVNRPELADKLEAAVEALHKDDDYEACLEVADAVQDAAWKSMLADRSTAHRCWKEAFVLARTMMAAAALMQGDAKRCVEHADFAFIMGAPKQEVNLIFRLVAPHCPTGASTSVDGARLPDRATVDALAFEVEALRHELSPAAKLEPLKGESEVLDNPSLDELAAACLPGDRGRAVLIRGMVEDWPALKEWYDLEFFVSRYGNRRVPIEVGSRLESMKEEVTTFGSFLADYIGPRCRASAEAAKASPSKQKAPQPRDHVTYLAQHNLLEQLPELLRMAPVPRFCTYEGASLDASSVWFGTDDTVTLLHYDSYDNFLVQVAGAKYVVLFDGSQFEELYVSRGRSEGEEFLAQGNTSAVDVGNPDLTKFPKYAKAQGKIVVLRPGDTLYIPQGMWHYVRSLTPSLSVNFWFSRSVM